jgi:hypothetical protein
MTSVWARVFMDMTSEAQATKAKIDKWNPSNYKSSTWQKKTVKRQLWDRKYLQIIHLTSSLYSK